MNDITFDGSRILGKSREGSGCLVFDRVRTRVEQLEDTLDVPRLQSRGRVNQNFQEERHKPRTYLQSSFVSSSTRF